MAGTEGSSLNETESLREEFAKMGMAVDLTLRAWSGMYPIAGGYSSWGLLFTRQRALAFVGDSIELWAIYTGPTPVKRLWVARRTCLDVNRNGQSGYIRARVGSKKFWVRRDDRSQLIEGVERSQ